MTHKELLSRVKAQFKPNTTKALKKRSKQAVRRLKEAHLSRSKYNMVKVWDNINWTLLEDVKRIKLNSFNY